MILRIKDLFVDVKTEYGCLGVLRGLSLEMNEGEIYGLVGESGCGKTLTALSILRLLDHSFIIRSGAIFFLEKNLLFLPEKEMERIRGKEISIVFQEPMTSLNPVIKIGDQISEMFEIHLRLEKKEAQMRAIELLVEVGFEDAKKRYHQYPHQLSGGQRQRVLLAIAISLNPKLIICDEPTTALDVASEREILDLLFRLVKERKMAMLFITHNLQIVEKLCDRIGIMYLGKIVEEQKKDRFFEGPLHPYSQGLLRSSLMKGERLKPIRGNVPDLRNIPDGCEFHPRCDYVKELCLRERPEVLKIDDDTYVRCFLYKT